MTVAAPATSNWFMDTRGVFTLGTTLRPTRSATAPMGALIQKMVCHPAQRLAGVGGTVVGGGGRCGSGACGGVDRERLGGGFGVHDYSLARC
jgi:hypothetical protein